MLKYIILIMALIIMAGANAAIYPRLLSADEHIKMVNYDPNNVVMINSKYGYETDIVFSSHETVENVSIGDSLAWQAVPVKNNLFIKPLASSKTNMTVLTNCYTYNFQLNSNHIHINPIYKLQFIYPSGGYNATGNAQAITTFNPDDLNSAYSFTSYRAIAPTAAFDNGQFTYFKFKRTIPAIYLVTNNHQETLINYHMQGQYVVVDTIAAQFILRFGESVANVYNDKLIGDWQTVKNNRIS